MCIVRGKTGAHSKQHTPNHTREERMFPCFQQLGIGGVAGGVAFRPAVDGRLGGCCLSGASPSLAVCVCLLVAG